VIASEAEDVVLDSPRLMSDTNKVGLDGP